MKKKSWVSAICVFTVMTLLIVSLGVQPAQAASLTLNKANYASSETITVNYSPPAPSDLAWIGIVPSNVAHDESAADDNDSDYKYPADYPGGTLQLQAPATPGRYDVRYYSDDEGGAELASVTFTVGTVISGSLILNKTSFAPSEAIQVTFSPTTGLSDKAWIGVVPSNIAHGSEELADQNDTDYEYVSDFPGGRLELSAPNIPGTYNVRFYSDDIDGSELASVDLTVTGTVTVPGTNPGSRPSQNQTITLTATPGNAQVKLDWTVPSGMTGITGYHLFRGTSAGGESTAPVTDFLITGTTHTDKNVVNGTAYYYILKPVYSGNTLGSGSNEVSATPSGTSTSNPGSTGTNVIVLQIGNPSVRVNGVTTVIDAPATIVNGRTMVPLRFIGEAMGGTVAWDSNEQKVTLNVKSTQILLWLGSTRTVVNGQEKFTDVPPQIINGRTMVPLRFILENLNCQVNWESSTQTVTITY